jgi:hypothetical protein
VMLAAPVGAAADLHVEAGNQIGQVRRRADVLFQRASQSTGLRDRQLAGLRPGQLPTSASVSAPPGEPRSREPAIELRHVAPAHPSHHEVLIGGHPRAPSE